MADDDSENTEEAREETAGGEAEEKSFRERVEEIRQQRAEEREEGDEGEMSREERMEEMMGGGGGPGGPGGMGGNPFAQMMGGMMGGGGPGGPGGMGGQPGPGREQESGGDNEDLTREIRKLRDEVNDVRRTLDRIADALED
ncbi:hypothetical protein ACFQJ5_10910 [Halomicroarcula sp. GCM10025324]|uniref:hypothetical protein n=1 Tax=Haloarcula TaxID=2237 RepID=UPI0023E87DCB|nr:hypothetical protein [Halomicroarcula sp. ZS-22-S1]